MKEFVDKLIGRLEELQKLNYEAYEVARHIPDKIGYIHTSNAYANAIEIINELAEEYINTSTEHINTSTDSSTWIPCSERLPEIDGGYICTAKDVEESLELIYSTWDNSWMDEFDSEYEVIAWMPLPLPYKAGD